MTDSRLDPKGIIPSGTEAEVLTTTGGVAGWATLPVAGIQTVTAGPYIEIDDSDPLNIIVTAMVPMTTYVDGDWKIVCDVDGEIVYTEAP